MTRLWIDGQEAVLPAGLTVQVKRENPFFTKSGEYTYDLTLSLAAPANAALYGHLNRQHSVGPEATGRRAVLMADNRVYCAGTEIVTGWTESKVTIQIASGNAELNFLIGGSLKIKWLKMTFRDGSESSGISPEEWIMQHVQQTWPEVDYCYCPVLNGDTAEIVNEWKADFSALPVCTYIGMRRQPFLMAYLESVLRAVGYELTENQYRDTPMAHLYIPTLAENWAEVMGEWSVNDFLGEVERLLDAVLIVDNRTRTCALMARAGYYHGGHTSHVRLVCDLYEAETDDEPEMDDNTSANLRFVDTGTTWWRYHRLSETVTQNAKRATIPADFTAEGDRLAAWFADTGHQAADTLYDDPVTGRTYLYMGDETENDGPYYVKGHTIARPYLMVDEYRNLEREEATGDVELYLGPVEMARVVVDHYTYHNGDDPQQDTYWHVPMPMPVVRSQAEEQAADGSNLRELIEGESGTTTPSEESNSEGSNKQPVGIAFYDGLTTYNVSYNPDYQYPIAYTDEWQEWMTNDSITYRRTNSTGCSLRLETLDTQLYQGGYDIDYTRQIKVTSYDDNLFDPRTIFEINYKRYVCKELEYTLTEKGRKGAWTGTFYPIRISDTEADARWILTDGKWRDGGVWIDNGRWLDE